MKKTLIRFQKNYQKRLKILFLDHQFMTAPLHLKQEYIL